MESSLIRGRSVMYIHFLLSDCKLIIVLLINGSDFRKDSHFFCLFLVYLKNNVFLCGVEFFINIKITGLKIRVVYHGLVMGLPVKVVPFSPRFD